MLNPSDYHVGWISAIGTEYLAAQEFLDDEYPGQVDKAPNDNNHYTLGKMGNHNVVLAVLPKGEYGVSSAASVARDMLHTFPNIRIGLMVGIGGGAPSEKHEIRLGDIVVSSPEGGRGGVWQYNFGKTIQDREFKPTGHLNQPPIFIRTAVQGLGTRYERKGHKFEETITRMLEKNPRLQKKYQKPDPSSDRLYKSTATHPYGAESCEGTCDPSDLIPHRQRLEYEDNPAIHYGLIASADNLMKDALLRDKFAREEDVLCFEMEAAGLMNHFPCLVIRGICDYSDSHKNKEWQGYAALVAAAYAKDLLGEIAPSKVETEKKITEVLSEQLSTVSGNVEQLLHEKHSQRFQDMLHWLTPADYSSKQNTLISTRQEGTGEWLLQSPNFQDWVQQKNPLLFCPGIPGAGKTIITSVVVDYLQKRFPHSNCGIAYLFCDYKEGSRRSLLELLLSLLKQLVRPSTQEKVADLYKLHRTHNTRPSVAEVSATLQSVVTFYTRTFVLVDAQDECEVWSELLDVIFQLQTKTGAALFATSRPIPDIMTKFEEKESLVQWIHAKEDDVRRFIKGNMSRLPRFLSKNLSLQEEILRVIPREARGIFLLARLYLESLIGKRSPKAIEVALENLQMRSSTSKESAIDRAYEDVMERITSQQGDHPETATLVLSWVVFAARPLSVLELQHALAVDVDTNALDEKNFTEPEDMVSPCCGLVDIDNDRNVIRLVHYTAQGFFESTCSRWLPNAQANLTRTCITYLSYDVFDDGCFEMAGGYYQAIRSNMLCSYAANSWGLHARLSSLDGDKLVVDFLESKEKISSCSQVLVLTNGFINGADRNSPTQMTGLHIAAYFGLVKSVVALLDRLHVNVEDRYGRTPLIWAAGRGQEAAVRLLLDKGADLHKRDDYYQRDALLWAAADGHETVVKILANRGSDIHAESPASTKYAFQGGMKALHEAARGGHDKVVSYLLQQGAGIEDKCNWGHTALLCAAEKGHVAVVSLLLEAGADIESILSSGAHSYTALQLAAMNGHDGVVQLLLGKGANVEAGALGAGTPLQLAASRGSELVVQILVDKGANVNARAGAGGNAMALISAVSNESHAITQLLLQTGAFVNQRSENEATALHIAVDRGHDKVVRLLLDHGADVGARDRGSQTPLHQAKRPEVARILLEHGASVDPRDNTGATPVHSAMDRYGPRDPDTVRLLLENGADVNARNNYGRTALSAAVRKGEGHVRLLLEYGASVRLEGEALQLAAISSLDGVLRLLLDSGLDVNTLDQYRQTTLHLAVRGCLEQVRERAEATVRLLLERGIDVDSQDIAGRTALQVAAEGANAGLVEILLENRVTIDIADDGGKTALHWATRRLDSAARDQAVSVIRLLVDHGADIKMTDNEGKTVLHWIELRAKDLAENINLEGLGQQ